jgi:hypothetical protein
MKPRIGPWRVAGEHVAYENPWIRVTHHDVITPSGTDGIYGKVHYKTGPLASFQLMSKGVRIWLDSIGFRWINTVGKFPKAEVH